MRQIVILNEAQFQKVIAESVKKVINEIGDTPKGQYMLGRLAGRKAYRDNDLEGVVDTNMHAWKQHKSTDSNGHGIQSDDFTRGVSDERKKERPQQTTVGVNESVLKRIVAESVKKVLKESDDMEQYNYTVKVDDDGTRYIRCKECGNLCIEHDGNYECPVCGNNGYVGEPLGTH